MKRMLQILTTIIVSLMLFGCSQNNTHIEETSKPGDSSQKDLFVALTKPIVDDKLQNMPPDEEYSVFDIMFEDNKYGVSNKKEIMGNEEDKEALSEVLENEAKQVILDVKSDNKYKRINVNRREILIEDDETSIAYVVIYDNEFYWLIMYNEGKAYAVQDTLGTLKKTEVQN